MGQRIDQFSEAVRSKLTSIDTAYDAIHAKIGGKAQDTQAAIRGQLENVRKRIEQDREKVSAAKAAAKTWLEVHSSATAGRVAQWKAERATHKLQQRADSAEQYAEDAVCVAMAAIDEAEQAALEAWLARHEADETLDKEAAHAAS